MSYTAVGPDDLERYDAATAHLEPPFAVVDLTAMRANAEAMTRRAAGKRIRLASKSVRCRELMDQVLATEGFRGVLAFTLSGQLWAARPADGSVRRLPAGEPAMDPRPDPAARPRRRGT